MLFLIKSKTLHAITLLSLSLSLFYSHTRGSLFYARTPTYRVSWYFILWLFHTAETFSPLIQDFLSLSPLSHSPLSLTYTHKHTHTHTHTYTDTLLSLSLLARTQPLSLTHTHHVYLSKKRVIYSSFCAQVLFMHSCHHVSFFAFLLFCRRIFSELFLLFSNPVKGSDRCRMPTDLTDDGWNLTDHHVWVSFLT